MKDGRQKVLGCLLYILCVSAFALEVPDVLRMPDGSRIESAIEWRTRACGQILDFFERNVYGKMPPRPAKMEFRQVEGSDMALGGTAIRRQFKVVSKDACGRHSFDVLVYVPKSDKKVPAFVCPNFSGNHSIIDDKAVVLPTCPLYKGDKAEDSMRGWRPERIPIKDIVAAGFAIATFCHCDVYPDYASTMGRNQMEGAAESIWTIFPPEKRDHSLALAAWAWGNMRVLDLLETLPEIDARKVAVAGQSRLAKAAVITAAYDERFAMCCPNAGGCKTLTLVPNLRFPAWFAPEMTNWTAIAASGLSAVETSKLRNGKPIPPFDEYSLIACIAPRAIHLGTSTKDIYAPPDVHFAAVKAVEPVWRLFGGKIFPSADRMLVSEPFIGDISWHCKEGIHSITCEDWKAYLLSAAKVFNL